MNTKTKLKKPLHVLIDGADNTGKSTVVNLLSRTLNIPIIKMPNMTEYIDKNQTEEFSKLFNETLIQFGEFDFIMDRGFTSSIVYSRIFKREFPLDYIPKIEQQLSPQVFIFTNQRTADYSTFYKFDKDEIIQIEDSHVEINKEFTRLAESRDYHLINVFNKSPIDICNEILNNLTSSEEESQD